MSSRSPDPSVRDPLENRISLQKLEVFCVVVRLGGVRRAAEELFISQPVVSAHIRSLQERLGVKLFRREGRGIALTEAGMRVHGWAMNVLRGRAELDSDLKNLTKGMAGAVNVSSTMLVGSYVLPEILIKFRRQCPGVLITES